MRVCMVSARLQLIHNGIYYCYSWAMTIVAHVTTAATVYVCVYQSNDDNIVYNIF